MNIPGRYESRRPAVEFGSSLSGLRLARHRLKSIWLLRWEIAPQHARVIAAGSEQGERGINVLLAKVWRQVALSQVIAPFAYCGLCDDAKAGVVEAADQAASSEIKSLLEVIHCVNASRLP